MRPVRYLFLNRGLGMSTGKSCAQVAHAEMLAEEDYWLAMAGSQELSWVDARRADLHREWIQSGHYTKLVMLATDSEHLRSIKDYIEARGYRTYLVIDEGRTEIAAHSPTALAVELVDKDDERAQQHFGEFRVYKDAKPKVPMEKSKLGNWFTGKK